MRPLERGTVHLIVILLTAGLISVACERAPTDVPTVGSVRLAGGPDKDPTVSGTEPDSAPQDTTLDVEIQGSNFDDGSTAEFAIDGVPSEKVTTNSTRFVNPKKLVANITIAVDAEVELYDVIVTTARRKKGVGTDLFSVVEKSTGQGTEEVLPLSAAARDASGDNLGSDGMGSYTHGTEGLTTWIAEPSKGGYFSFDALQSTRSICLDFSQPEATPSEPPPFESDCVSVRVGSKILLNGQGNEVDGGMRKMAVGAVDYEFRQLQVWFLAGDPSLQYFLRFGHDCDGDPVLSEKRVAVTHPTASTWGLEGQSARLCRESTKKGKPGRLVEVGDFHMPFSLSLAELP